MVLDPMSPGGLSCDGTGEILDSGPRTSDPRIYNPSTLTPKPGGNVLVTKEYQQLLAVARGQAEPQEDDDDEDDEDFVPGSDAEGLRSPAMDDELVDDDDVPVVVSLDPDPC